MKAPVTFSVSPTALSRSSTRPVLLNVSSAREHAAPLIERTVPLLLTTSVPAPNRLVPIASNVPALLSDVGIVGEVDAAADRAGRGGGDRRRAARGLDLEAVGRGQQAAHRDAAGRGGGDDDRVGRGAGDADIVDVDRRPRPCPPMARMPVAPAPVVPTVPVLVMPTLPVVVAPRMAIPLAPVVVTAPLAMVTLPVVARASMPTPTVLTAPLLVTLTVPVPVTARTPMAAAPAVVTALLVTVTLPAPRVCASMPLPPAAPVLTAPLLVT